MIRAVFRKDLAVLWLSPVPYVVGALLHLVLGFLYVNQLNVRVQAVIQPLFPIAGFLLLAMIPLLTMRSFAEELRTGTLDVLQAIPVRGRQLVLGKWLACWVTTLLVAAPAVLFVVLLHLWGDPDSGPMISGFVGLGLFAAALTALGVAASTLTASQPVAAMIAFFASLLLWFAHVGGQGLSTGVLASLSLSERLRAFSGGAIDSADVSFLVLLAVGCLVVASAVVNGRRSA